MPHRWFPRKREPITPGFRHRAHGYGSSPARGRRNAWLDLLSAAVAAHAFFQNLDIVLDVWVGRIHLERLAELGARAHVVPAQHVREALVVEDLGRRPDDADGCRVGAVGEL